MDIDTIEKIENVKKSLSQKFNILKLFIKICDILKKENFYLSLYGFYSIIEENSLNNIEQNIFDNSKKDSFDNIVRIFRDKGFEQVKPLIKQITNKRKEEIFLAIIDSLAEGKYVVEIINNKGNILNTEKIKDFLEY